MNILRRRVLQSAVLLGLLVSAGLAPAFGPLGHNTVGAIADRLLNAKARQAVAALLANDLTNKELPSGRHTLAEIASWSDEIRSTSQNKPLWHFDDAPACGPVPADRPWCPNGECASKKVEDLLVVMADTNANTRDRNEALKWIVHLVGDLHQPLHAVTNTYATGIVDSLGNPTDRGGNDVMVALEGVQTKGAKKLHGVWDTELVALALKVPQKTKAASAAVITQLANKAKALPDSKTSVVPMDWVMETNALARDVAYAVDGFACFEPDDTLTVLDAQYIKNAKKVVHDQLIKAGARLAKLINGALGS